MRRPFLALTLIALSALPLLASAQQASPPDAAASGDLQRIVVGKLTYPVDPYNVFVCFPIATNQQWNGTGVDGNTTLQCFIRKGSVMTPIDAFLTDNSGVLEGVELGTPIYSEAQGS